MPFFAKSSTILGACALTTSLVPNYSVVTVNAGRNGGNGKRAKEGERQFQTMEQLMKIIDYEFPEVKYWWVCDWFSCDLSVLSGRKPQLDLIHFERVM